MADILLDRMFGKVNLDERVLDNLLELQRLNLNLELCITDSRYLFEKFCTAESLLRLKIAELNLKSNFHLPFYGLQLGCKDHYIRELSLKLIMQGLHLAAELQIPRAIMHLSFPPYIPIKGQQKWLDSFYRNLEKILEYCQQKNITLLLENTHEHLPEIFSSIFENYPTGYLAMCLDIAHIYCYSPASFAEWWSACSDNIKVIHLSDNYGDEDSHLPLGDGKIDFRELFDASAGKDLTYTLETDVTGFAKSLEYIRELLPEKYNNRQSDSSRECIDSNGR